jgi:hypothetical protein
MTKYGKRRGGGGGGTTSSVPDWAVPYLKNVGNQAEGMYKRGDLGKVAGSSELQNVAFGQGASAMGTVAGQGLDQLASQQGRLAQSATNTNDMTLQRHVADLGLGALGEQQTRLNSMATAPTQQTLDAQTANVLHEAQKKVAGLTTGFGEAGTLGSARQAVMQGAQNAETVGQMAKVRADYEDNMFKNRLQSEQQLGQSVQGSSGLASMSGAQDTANAANRLQSEQALGQSVQGSGALASQTASGLANLGDQQRGITQQSLDAPYQALERYSSTVYGNPARQSVSAGGK